MIPTFLVIISCLFYSDFKISLMVNSENISIGTLGAMQLIRLAEKVKLELSLKGEILKMFKNMFKSHGKRVNSCGFPLKCWSWILEVCWPVHTTIPSIFLYLWFQFLIFQDYLPGEFPALKTFQIELLKKSSSREFCIFGVLGQCLPFFKKKPFQYLHFCSWCPFFLQYFRPGYLFLAIVKRT